MKKNLLLIGIALLTVLSCSKSEIPSSPEEKAIGKISLTFTSKAKNTLTSSKSLKVLNDVPFQIVATITDAENNIVINNESYTLTNFNNSFITSSIELPIGDYKLTGFNVVNSDNQVIFSAPLADSEFADLVNTPLPISFSVTESNDNSAPKILNPEVLKVEITNTPAQFGYVSFTFNVIDTVNLFIQVLENGDNINTSGAIAKIGNIPDNDFITRTLLDGVNTVKIPLNDFNSNSIELVVSYSNFADQAFSLLPDQLNQYSLTNPFIVSFDVAVTDPNILTPTVTEVLFKNRAPSNSISDTENNILFNDITLSDIDKDGFNQYYIASSSNTESVLINLNRESGGASFVQTYSKQDQFGFFNTVHTYDGGYILAGGGQIYRFKNTDADGLIFTKFDYNQINDNLFDNVFIANNIVYALADKTLYRSDNFGESFTLVNNNFPFSSFVDGVNKIASKGNSIYAIDNGTIFSSTDNGETFSEFANTGDTLLNSIFIQKDRIFAFGGNNAAFQTGTITSGEKSFTVPSRTFNPNDGAFIGFLLNTDISGNSEFANIYYTSTHYKGETSGFSISAESILFNIPVEKPITISSLKEVIIGPFGIEVIGISNNSIHLNLQ